MKRIMLVYDDKDFQKLKEKKDTTNWRNWEDFVFNLIIKAERRKT